jgi:hypothetical protein
VIERENLTASRIKLGSADMRYVILEERFVS